MKKKCLLLYRVIIGNTDIDQEDMKLARQASRLLRKRILNINASLYYHQDVIRNKQIRLQKELEHDNTLKKRIAFLSSNQINIIQNSAVFMYDFLQM